MSRLALSLVLLAATVWAQSGAPKRILYVTHSAGYKHESIPHSIDALKAIAKTTGKLEITATEDVSLLNAAELRNYDAVMFYTTGELPISDQQKQDLLDFVNSGKGFAGVHSATDTFYKWPEYADLIGGWFNGHPWTQSVKIKVADPESPLVRHLAPSFEVRDEIYQFKNFAEGRVRVLLKLDTRSVNMNAKGINPGATEFPLVWVRSYGSGRVFYSALGHFDDVWDMPGVRGMLLEGMLWITGQIEAPSTPR